MRSTLPFVKTVGTEVFRGNLDRAGEQNCRSCQGVGFLWSYQSVPPNLAASLDARKRLDAMTFEKKEVAVPLSAPESDPTPCGLLGLDVTGDQSEGSELTFVFARTPYLGFLAIAA